MISHYVGYRRYPPVKLLVMIRVSDCCSAIVQLYHGENKFIFNEMMMRSALFFIVLAHWNNSPRVDMSTHPDTLFWFRARSP